MQTNYSYCVELTRHINEEIGVQQVLHLYIREGEGGAHNSTLIISLAVYGLYITTLNDIYTGE